MAHKNPQSPYASAAPVDPLLTGKEAAPLLGISYPTFLRRVADGTIPKPLKLGALSRWPQSEILAVIEAAKALRAKSAEGVKGGAE